MTLESKIEDYLIDCCKKQSMLLRKVQWIGRRAAPDRIIISAGQVVFVELKKHGEKLKAHQAREIERLRSEDANVAVIDSKEKIDTLLENIRNGFYS